MIDRDHSEHWEPLPFNASDRARLARLERLADSSDRRQLFLERRWKSIDTGLRDIKRLIIGATMASGIIFEILRFYQTGQF